MGSSRPVASLLAALLTLAPALASAQKPPTDKEKKAAGDLVKKAIAASKEGDHKTAIELYLNAFSIVPQPLLLSNIGSEYQLANKPVDALTYFCKYLEADPKGSNASYATAQAKVLQTQLGREINENDVCHPIEKPVPVVTKVETKPEPVKPPESTKPPEPTPAPAPEPPTVTGTAGLDHTDATPASSPGHGLRLAGLGVGAAGVAAFGVGVVYAIKGKNLNDYVNNYTTAHPNQAWPDDIAAKEQEGHDDNRMQAIFMIAGGVAIIGGATMYVLGRKKASSSEHVSVQPIATPTSVGVALTGGY